VNRMRGALPWVVSLGSVGAAWQVLSVVSDARAFPPLSRILDAAIGAARTSDFWSSFTTTILIALVGLIAGLVLAVPLGLAIGLSDVAERSTRFMLDFLKVIPPIVVLPLVLLMYGPTVRMAITLVIFGVAFPLIVQTVYGVRDTDAVLKDTLSAYGANRLQRVWYSALPSALPFIGTGLRISAAVALIVAVVAGLVGSAPGLGRDLQLAQNGGNYALGYALVVILGIVGVAANAAVARVDNRLVFWRGKA
jgi:ABC-type nitrate/sulfonate/bicarbonate transport system permease component